MNKLLAGGVLAFAGVTGAAVITLNQMGMLPSMTGEQATGADQGSALLAYVPDDTVIFSGGLEPFPYRQVLQSFDFTLPFTAEEQAELEAAVADTSPGLRMLAGMYMELRNVDRSEAIIDLLGLPDQVNVAFYTVGAAPVLRIELADPAAFDAFLDASARRLGATATEATTGGVTYRRYTLHEGKGDEEPLYLAVGVNASVASVFLDNRQFGGERLSAYALGLERPERSLADSDRLQTLVQEHGFLPSTISYLDHREIVRAIAEQDGNRLGRVLTEALGESDSSDVAWLKDVREGACREDMLAIAESWPRTSLGYTRMEFGNPAVLDMAVIIESRDRQTMDALSSLRGHVPAHLSGNTATAPFGMALGLKADALGPFLVQTWQRLVEAEFRCEALRSMQAELRGSNPAMAGAMFGMVSGMRGLSASLQKLELGPIGANGVPESYDISGLVTLSAEDPRALLMMAQSMMPELGKIRVPADGTPVPLSLPMANGMDTQPMIVMRGSHLAIYTGEQAETVAMAMDQDPLDTNGFFTFDLDYGLYGAFGDAMMQQVHSAEREKLEALVDALANSGFKLRSGMDFASNGILFELSMTKDASE